MRVLAIDPGYDRVGAAVLEHAENTEKLLYSTCIETSRTLSVPERIGVLGTEIETLLRTHQPDALAIETLFFNKNQKTAIGVAQARGVIIYLALQAGCTIYEFGPQEIKVAITGYGKSDKAAVINMVTRLVSNTPPKAHDDEYDAIAIGVTCLAHHR